MQPLLYIEITKSTWDFLDRKWTLCYDIAI